MKILNILKSILVLMVLAISLGPLSANAQEQMVTPVPSDISVTSSGDQVIFDVNYNTDDSNANLTGLGILMHWDSSKLNYVAFSNVSSQGDLVQQQGPRAETADDGDPDTDTEILFTWISFGGTWPGALPHKLFDVEFTAEVGLAQQGVESHVRFTPTSTAAGYSLTTTPARVRGPVALAVPNVVGQTQAAAEGAIVAAGLVVGTVTLANSATVPIGVVISHTPAAGTNVSAGSAVNLVISQGVVVPNVVGQSQGNATTAITNAGLTVGTVTQTSSATVPVGDVISQNPAGGAQANPGSAVGLVISQGLVIPDVVGQTQTAAESAIVAVGLVVGLVTQANSMTVPIGSVISQTPAAGTNVSTGSSVNLVISLGVLVPDVVGQTQAAATTAITGAGLTVGNVTQANSATVPVGNVISQNPTGGTNANSGSAVDLVISGIAIPDVVGLSQAEAEAAIISAGLTVGTVTQQNSTTVPEGDVISQNPTASSSAAPGSPVDLVISAPAPAPIPAISSLGLVLLGSLMLGLGVIGVVPLGRH